MKGEGKGEREGEKEGEREGEREEEREGEREGSSGVFREAEKDWMGRHTIIVPDDNGGFSLCPLNVHPYVCSSQCHHKQL